MSGSNNGPMGARMRLRVAFTLASLTHGAGQNIVMLLALRYFTDNLGLAASIGGLLFAGVKIYDGLFDPVLGSLSDRTRGKLGRRLPYLLGGSILMPIAVVLIFAVSPDWPHSTVIVFLTVLLVVHASAYTALTVPGMAMVVEVSDDFHERSTLMSYRTVGNTLGFLAGSALPAWLLARTGSTREGHIWVAAVVAVIVLVAGVLATWLLIDAPRTRPGNDPPRFRLTDIGSQLQLAWRNRPFRQLASAHIFVLIGTATGTVSNAHFSRYVLQRTDNWLRDYFVFATIGIVCSMPLWLKVARVVGKKSCYVAAMLGFGAVHLSWITAGPNEPYVLMVVRTLLVGVASAGTIMFAYSMLSDAIRYDYIQTGLRREGAFAGFTSLLDKLAAAAGIAALTTAMSAMGYQSSTTGGQLQQSASAIESIYLGFAIMPAVAMMLGVMCIWRYRLDAADLLESNRAVESQAVSGA